MKNLPTSDRFSSKILKDLSRVRNQLTGVENSNQPFTHLINPLLSRDELLSRLLVECLIHEMDLKAKDLDFKKENKG